LDDDEKFRLAAAIMHASKDSRIAELEAALRQRTEALMQIREKAATMPNGGAWAAGLAALSLAG